MGTKPKAGKPAKKIEDKEKQKAQSDRFLSAVHELNVEETLGEFEKNLARIAPAKKRFQA